MQKAESVDFTKSLGFQTIAEAGSVGTFDWVEEVPDEWRRGVSLVAFGSKINVVSQRASSADKARRVEVRQSCLRRAPGVGPRCSDLPNHRGAVAQGGGSVTKAYVPALSPLLLAMFLIGVSTSSPAERLLLADTFHDESAAFALHVTLHWKLFFVLRLSLFRSKPQKTSFC